MNQLYIIYNQYYNEIILGLFVITLLVSLLAIIELRRLNRKYKVFMNALSGKDIEGLLLEHMDSVKNISKENENLSQEVKEIKNTLSSCFQKHGVVRYTAFDDVGSDLSFALTLLDGKDNGVILNGIYSREGSSIYAKPVHNGQTKYNLSEEEQKALENAKRRG